MEEKTMDFWRIILSLIVPPVGVFFQVGFGLHFWINILLTLCGYIPGLIHAIWIIRVCPTFCTKTFVSPRENRAFLIMRILLY